MVFAIVFITAPFLSDWTGSSGYAVPVWATQAETKVTLVSIGRLASVGSQQWCGSVSLLTDYCEYSDRNPWDLLVMRRAEYSVHREMSSKRLIRFGDSVFPVFLDC